MAGTDVDSKVMASRLKVIADQKEMVEWKPKGGSKPRSDGERAKAYPKLMADRRLETEGWLET